MSEYHLNISGRLKEEDYKIIEQYLDIIEYDDLLIVNPYTEDNADTERVMKLMESSGFHTRLSRNKKSGRDFIMAARV